MLLYRQVVSYNLLLINKLKLQSESSKYYALNQYLICACLIIKI